MVWLWEGLNRLSAKSASGRVSRVSPVQTAVRNCTRDEGGPFGFGDVTFQLAEVAVPGDLFRKILSLIDDLRRRPVPA